MAATASTAGCSCENWRSQHHCNKANKEKQKFRIIHNGSWFYIYIIRHRTRFKVSFYFYGGKELNKTGGSPPLFSLRTAGQNQPNSPLTRSVRAHLSPEIPSSN